VSSGIRVRPIATHDAAGNAVWNVAIQRRASSTAADQ
jgi:hypothetical protein